MKIEKGKSDFTPVIITLENQDEVNELFAMFNFSTVIDPLREVDDGFALFMFNNLQPFRTAGYERFHDAIDKNWRKGR